MNQSRPESRTFILDDLNPEDGAMLQALYSRSSESALVHRKKVDETGSGKFMEQFYVGYGHQSIGDCGTTTLYFENVSTLAAKAIQDWPLYSGQETSTRYIDMSKQPIVHPLEGSYGESAGRRVHQRWMEFYEQGMAEMVEEIVRRRPIEANEDDAIYKRAVNAKVFDIMRGFLPAGICTQLSWHTNLRQCREHLDALQFHPAIEVKKLALAAKEQLKTRYPSSGFSKEPRSTDWMFELADLALIDSGALGFTDRAHVDVDDAYSPVRTAAIRALQRRPQGSVPPHVAGSLANVSASFLIDFGSFRDIQRHRKGVCQMPLLTPERFHPWYLHQLSTNLRAKAIQLLDAQEDDYGFIKKAVSADKVDLQYYCALGHTVRVYATYPLDAAIYIGELRSTPFIHPTLRRIVVYVLNAALKNFLDEYNAPFYGATEISPEEDFLNLRRGTQTIFQKK